MAKKFDQVLVIAVEKTCWEKEPPEGEVSEIIEVGICSLDLKNLERGKQDRILIRPELSTVSEYCTTLTSLTAEEVGSGLRFKQACTRLAKRFNSRDRLWASYSDEDPRLFETQCQRAQIPNPFGQTHLNVSNLFALMHGLMEEVTFPQALELLKTPPEGKPNCAVDDAWNVAGILARILAVHRIPE